VSYRADPQAWDITNIHVNKNSAEGIKMVIVSGILFDISGTIGIERN
jgi:hypothetical protein